MSVVSMKQLLEAGVHFGHQTRRCFMDTTDICFFSFFFRFFPPETSSPLPSRSPGHVEASPSPCEMP